MKDAKDRWREANKDEVKAKRSMANLKQYGISSQTYQEMLLAQGGLCKVCQSPPDGRWGKLNVDHCHTTGNVRGLLCLRCNRAAGLLKDSPSIAARVAAYLRQAQDKS